MTYPTNENASAEAGTNVDSAGGLDATKQISKGFHESSGIADQVQSLIEILPEFESLIPPLHHDEFAQLEANILAEGCRDPLVLMGDVLVDGHNRYSICRKHGITFQTVQVQGIETINDAVLWIIKNQLGRRNIVDYVRGELALRAKPIIEERARQRQESTQIRDGFTVAQISAEPAIETRTVVASAAGVSHDTITKIEKIQATASPELLAAVRSGDVSINAAAKVAAMPMAEQVAIAAAGPAAIKQAASRSVPPKPVSDELQRLRDENADLRERLIELQDSLKQTVADNEMMGRVFDAGDQLKAAMDECRRQKAIADSAERSLAGKTGEFNERARAVTYWKNRAEKAEKALAKVVA